MLNPIKKAEEKKTTINQTLETNTQTDGEL